MPCFGSIAEAAVARQLVTDPSVVQDGERWMVVTCYFEGNVSWIDSVYRIGDPVGVAQLLERAKDYLVVPEPEPTLAPAIDAVHLVGMPEYLAVDEATWRPWSATASVPGVAVTLTATPIETRWDLGNGDTVTCSGPGAPWQADRTAGSSSCTYTYQRSSTADRPGGSYQVSATTIWERTWTCAPDCGSGALPLLGRSTSFPLTVQQAQAVITRTRL